MSTNKELAEENKMLLSIIDKINQPEETGKISYDKLIEDNKVLREALEIIKERSTHLDNGVRANSAGDKQIAEIWEISFEALNNTKP